MIPLSMSLYFVIAFKHSPNQCILTYFIFFLFVINSYYHFASLLRFVYFFFIFEGTSEHTLRKLFKEFDEDGNGELDKDEFRLALKWKLGLMNIADADIFELFDYYDTDKGGGIDVNEFIDKVLPKDFTDENGGKH